MSSSRATQRGVPPRIQCVPGDKNVYCIGSRPKNQVTRNQRRFDYQIAMTNLIRHNQTSPQVQRYQDEISGCQCGFCKHFRKYRGCEDHFYCKDIMLTEAQFDWQQKIQPLGGPPYPRDHGGVAFCSKHDD
jgi:hypothetical protein